MNAAPIPRLPASPAITRRSDPAVITGLADAWPALRRWSFTHLAAEHRDLHVSVARTEQGAVVTDPGRGLVVSRKPLGSFLDALAAGDPCGYVMARLDELPRALREEAPAPPDCAGARWQVAKLWISATGATSALHFDLADNLHTVLAGKKRFLLFSPRDSAFVYPRGLLSSIPNGACVDPEAPDLRRFPLLARARPLVAEIGPGETIFIPRGYWHHVRSLESTIAVNWWWARGAHALVVEAADWIKRARGISR